MATRWLDENEQSTWRTYLAMTRLVNETLEGQLHRDAGMPLAYYVILAMLSEAPERTLRMNQLANIVGSSQSRLSHAVARMEASGWIHRRQCESDKRGYFAVLTDEGMAVVEKNAPLHVQRVRESLFDPLTEEQVTQLREIGEAVVARIKATPRPNEHPAP